jgi:hypothetical protein
VTLEERPDIHVRAAPSPGVQIDLRGCTVEEALEWLDHHLDAASRAALPCVRIIHGKRTGALRRPCATSWPTIPWPAPTRLAATGRAVRASPSPGGYRRSWMLRDAGPPPRRTKRKRKRKKPVSRMKAVSFPNGEGVCNHGNN